MTQKENGWRSCYTSFGHIELHFVGPLETLFSMIYGAEAVIPMGTGFPMLRTSSFTPSGNDELLEKSLDLIEDQRENAMIQLAYY